MRADRADDTLDEALLGLALAISQGLQEAVAQALIEASEAVDGLALRDAIDAGDLALVADLVRVAWRRGGAPRLALVLAAQLEPLVAAAAAAVTEASQAPPDTTGADARWLDVYLRARQTVLTAATLDGIEASIRRVLTSALPTRLLVDQVVALLGVHPRDWAGVVRLRDSLVQQGGPEAARATRMVRQHAQDLKQRRAAVIAAEEPWQVVQAVQQRVWARAARAGVVDRQTTRRFWIVRPDGCQQICLPVPGMNPRGVGFEQPFETPIGPRMVPTLHVRCRCGVRIARVAMAGVEG